jgi:peptidoglycan hydrolase-like protein with peptidoglycan-binding domain
MHFEYQGRSLWYGTPDAPAPRESVQAGTEIAVTIGVSPVDASNNVELLYRIDQGPTEMVAAKWVQNDPSGKAQYFRARLPAFRAGDTVEYIPICSCAGRQVPSPDKARQFASSIRITEAQAESPRGLRLRASDSGGEVARLHERRELHGVEVSPEERFVGPSTSSPPGTRPATGGHVIGAKTNQHRAEGPIFFDHGQLLAVGAVIAPDEQNQTRYGPSTGAAVSAFRQQHGLPAGDTVDLSTGRLMHVEAAFAGTGGREALRAAVREAASAADTSQPEELYWLARYAILAGDYQTAHDIAQQIPDHGGVRAVIDPIVALPDQPAQPNPGQPPTAPQPRSPEVPYPENFYAYRRPWVDPAAVERVALDWPNLKPTEHTPLQRDGGPPAIAALHYWHKGNSHFTRRRYDAAVSAYDACQDSVIAYFDKFYPDIVIPAGARTDRLVALITQLHELHINRLAFWDFIQRRRELLTLAELEEQDGIVPGDAYDSAINFVWHQMGDPVDSPDPLKDFRQRNLDAPLVTLAFVLVPLARAEANRARRQFDAALRDLRWVLDSIVVEVIGPTSENPAPIRRVFARLACEFIELPFAKLLLAETMLDKADAEYKARIAAELPPAPDLAIYQGLKAAQTYRDQGSIQQ